MRADQTQPLSATVALTTDAERGQCRAHAVRLSANGSRIIARLDVVVANAGICGPAPWDRITAEALRDTIDTNVTGTWNTVMASARQVSVGMGISYC